MTAYAPASLVSATCGAVAVVTHADRCACEHESQSTTYQLVSVPPGGSHHERDTVPRVQLQETTRKVSSGPLNDSGHRQPPHAPVRSHERRLGGCSRPLRGSAPRAEGTKKSDALPSTACTYSTHRVALFQLFQRGSAVWHQLYVDACANDALPCPGCCGSAQGKASPVQSWRRSTPGAGTATNH
jgi:hypothetical protein